MDLSRFSSTVLFFFHSPLVDQIVITKPFFQLCGNATPLHIAYVINVIIGVNKSSVFLLSSEDADVKSESVSKNLVLNMIIV